MTDKDYLEDEEVEVSFECGKLHSLVLSTCVKVNWNDKVKAQQKIKDIALNLIQAAPIKIIYSMDQEVLKQKNDFGIDESGNVVEVDTNQFAVVKLQKATKEKLEKEKPDDRSAEKK
jgi:hypothetical protein